MNTENAKEIVNAMESLLTTLSKMDEKERQSMLLLIVATFGKQLES